jgi:hypothetical protein
VTALYTQDDGDAIAELLVGHRIVSAEKGDFDYPGRSSWDVRAEGRLVLDDGTTLFLRGNEGGCSCSAGDYPLEKVAAVDNIITSARVEASPEGDDVDGEGAYRIFVFADNQEINVAEFVGSDGNGYYGTGFALTVVRPETPAGVTR